MKKVFLVTLLSHIILLMGTQVLAQQYTLEKLDKVNTFYHDAAPVISPDGKDLYFFVQDHPQNTFGEKGSQDIWVSHKNEEGVWSPAVHLGRPFNKKRSNQVFTVLPDKSLFVRGGSGKNTNAFSIVTPALNQTKVVLKNYFDMKKGRFSGASISSDVQHIILYFSERSGSVRSDLYASNRQSDGTWSQPIKLNISSQFDEYGPFIAPDDKTLYFASDRPDPARHGKADIYKSIRLDDTWQHWSNPVNVGSPINTAAGDAYFSIDAQGNIFTSRFNDLIDGGNLDIFVLTPKEIEIKVKGHVLDKETGTPVLSTVRIVPDKLDALNLETDVDGLYETRIPESNKLLIQASAEGYEPNDYSVVIPNLHGDTTLAVDIFLTPISRKIVLTGSVFDAATQKRLAADIQIFYPFVPTSIEVYAERGRYRMEDIVSSGWYTVNAAVEGYFNAEDSVYVEKGKTETVVLDLYLKKIEIGATVRLENVYFDFDKTTLKPESFPELNRVVDFLTRYPLVEIEIEGHTDSRGIEEYNLNLSQGRAQAVMEYLISQRVESKRLNAQGYGESKPIDSNATEEGRSRNRRVEFTVVKT